VEGKVLCGLRFVWVDACCIFPFHPGLGDPCRQPSFGTPQKKAKGRSLKRREGLAQRKYRLWVHEIRALYAGVVFRN